MIYMGCSPHCGRGGGNKVESRGKDMMDLRELLLNELAEIYDAEKQQTAAFSKLAGAADSPALQRALEKHLEQTWEHIQRVEEVFDTLEAKIGGKRSDAMAGLIAEGLERVEAEADPPVKDAALILAVQKIEHYEIASYGGLRTWAELLGRDEAAMLLEQTGDEEKEAGDLLNDIAGSINIEAAERGDENEILLAAYKPPRQTA